MAGEEKMRRGGGKRPIAIKVYIVHQRINLARAGQANSRIIAARLTRTAAEAIVADTPGTWVEKLIAVK